MADFERIYVFDFSRGKEASPRKLTNEMIASSGLLDADDPPR